MNSISKFRASIVALRTSYRESRAKGAGRIVSVLIALIVEVQVTDEIEARDE